MKLRTSAAGQQVRQYRLSRVARFALAAVLTVGAACAGDSSRSTSPTAGPAGQYELQTIDRVSLPARIYLGPGADPVTSRYYDQLDVVVNDGSVNFVSETQFAMVFSGSFKNGAVSIGLDLAGNGGTNQYTYRQ